LSLYYGADGLDDTATETGVLTAATYSLTVVIADTVIYDDAVRIV
jgi:hypothetical protein